MVLFTERSNSLSTVKLQSRSSFQILPADQTSSAALKKKPSWLHSWNTSISYPYMIIGGILQVLTW